MLLLLLLLGHLAGSYDWASNRRSGRTLPAKTEVLALLHGGTGPGAAHRRVATSRYLSNTISELRPEDRLTHPHIADWEVPEGRQIIESTNE